MIIKCDRGMMPTSYLQVKSKRNPLKVGDTFWGMPPEDFFLYRYDEQRKSLWKQYKVLGGIESNKNDLKYGGVTYRVQLIKHPT